MRFPTLFDCSFGRHQTSCSAMSSRHSLSFGRKSSSRNTRDASMNSCASVVAFPLVVSMTSSSKCDFRFSVLLCFDTWSKQLFEKPLHDQAINGSIVDCFPIVDTFH